MTRTTACVWLLVTVACAAEREPQVTVAAEAGNAMTVDSLARARQDSVNRSQPGYMVDSIFSMEEQLRRFRVGLPRVSAFADGAASRDALVQTLVRALESGDSTSLAALAVNQAEFAWLIFPPSAQASGPTQQPPQVVWYLLHRDSERGRHRLLQRLSGGGLRFERYRCREVAAAEGDNHFWNDCLVERRDEQGALVRQRLFGSIIERGGRWKLLSFANDF